MSKTYNGLVKPILLFSKDGEVFTPKPGLQPSYGIWESLEEARTGLIEEFESISNVPKGYTFAIMNQSDLPEEWWFTVAGDWDSIRRKGVSLIMLDIVDNQLKISYDGGWNWIPVGSLADPSSLTENIVLRVDNDGTIKISFNSGTTWQKAGQIKLRISDSGYLYITYDNWAHETLVGKVGDTGGQSSSGGGSSPVGNLDSQNIGSIPYEGVNDSESHTYTGQDACDLLVYFGVDQLDELNNYLEEHYPNASIGDYVIIRSTLYDRTGGMSNESDATHTYELDPAWTTQEILENNTQDDWYHYYKITKVGEGIWAAIAWVGRTPVYQDVVYYTLTIGTVNPQDAVVTVSYGDTIRTVHSGDTLSIPEGTSVTITAEKQGYDSYTNTITMSQNETVDITLAQTVTGYTVTIGSPINRATNAVITSGFELEYRYYDAGHVVRGYRVYPGDTINVQAGAEIYVLGTASGYYDWYYGGAEGVWVTINQDTTIVPAFTKIPDNKVKVKFSIVSVNYDPVTGLIIQGGPAADGGHCILEYYINDVLYTMRPGQDGWSIEMDKGDYFEATLKVVDASRPWTEDHRSRQKITATKSISFSTNPAGFRKLHIQNVTPENMFVVFNNDPAEIEATKGTYRYFYPGVSIHMVGSATGYQTKSWDVLMPDEDYSPVLVLDPIEE